MNLSPTSKWISVGDATRDIQNLSEQEIEETKPAPFDLKYWHKTAQGANYAAYIKKAEKRNSGFNIIRLNGAVPSCTLTSNAGNYTHWKECRKLTYREWKRLGSFPDDYQAKTDRIGKYIIGMSVPPKMTQVVAEAVCQQWLSTNEH